MNYDYDFASASSALYFIYNCDIFYATIAIEKCLYFSYKWFFDKLLKKFQSSTLPQDDCLYIFTSCAVQNHFSNVFYCDSQEDWIYQCITIIEEYIISRANFTTLHGSGLILNDTTFIILGERFSGKTTLTNYILNSTNAIFLDDDNIIYSSGKMYGLNLPIRLRTKPETNENLICKFSDECKKSRYLIDAPRSTTIGTNKSFIIFPHYIENCNFTSSKLGGQVLFEKLLKSVKYSASNQQCFKDVCELSKSVAAFAIEYENCSLVLEEMKKIESYE
jgi:hypothetical protein